MKMFSTHVKTTENQQNTTRLHSLFHNFNQYRFFYMCICNRFHPRSELIYWNLSEDELLLYNSVKDAEKEEADWSCRVEGVAAQKEDLGRASQSRSRCLSLLFGSF